MVSKYDEICADMINDYMFIEANLLDMYEDLDNIAIRNYPKAYIDDYNFLSTDNKISYYNQILTYKFKDLSSSEIDLIAGYINPIIIKTFTNINKKYSDFNRCYSIAGKIPLINGIIYRHLKDFYNKYNSLS